MQLISGPVYVVWILLLLKRHRKNIGLHFSFTEKIELKWLKNLTLGLGGVWLVILIVYAVWDLFNLQIPFERELIIYSAVTIFVFVIGFNGLKQTPILFTSFYNNILNDLDKTKVQLSANNKMNVSVEPKVTELEVNPISKDSAKIKETPKEETNKETEQNIDKLFIYMKEKKPYLDDKLMLSHVASSINIPHYKLTKIFNTTLNKNFFNFVNSYRVEEVKELLLDPKNDNFTILAIAYKSGFSSKASFNRIFKQMTNMTPSEYQKINRVELNTRN